MEVHALLEQVKSGQMKIEDAEQLLKNLPYEEMGFAKLDHHRKLRSGFGEVIYCAGKSLEHLTAIYRRFHQEQTDVMGTRASLEQAEAVRKEIPEVQYDPVSRILRLRFSPEKMGDGLVAVCTGGTSDIPVAEEAAQTIEFLGGKVQRLYDVGVAGLHRLLSNLEPIRQANCIVAVAGMEGALAGVLGGLVEHPVIAVPTSVGYGANFGGLSALLTMLNSCAEGIAVVNIDNGFGAGYLAAQINRQTGKDDRKD